MDNIILDWSGVLSDDFHLSYEGAMVVFDEVGWPRISEEEFREEFTLPYMNIYRMRGEISKEFVDGIFRPAIQKMRKPEPYEGAGDFLQHLKENGKRMVVLSSHNQSKLEEELNDYGWEGIFEEVLGSVHDKTKRIKRLMERNSFEQDNTCYVGDMVHDIEAGKSAGVVTIAVTWGYKTNEILESANPDYFADSFDELKELF